MQAKVEERLQEALQSDAGVDELIDVVVRFDQPKPGMDTSAMPLLERRERMAEATSQRIEQALARACEASGEEPAQVSLFPLVGSAFVQAHRPYLKALIDQTGVLGATLNSGGKA